MDVINIILIFVIIANVFIGTFTLSKNPKSKINQRWFLVAMAASLWVLAMILFRQATSSKEILLYCQLLYAAAALIPIIFIYFVIIFPKPYLSNLSNWLYFIVIIPAIGIIFLIFYQNSIVSNVVINDINEKINIWGKYYFLYVLYILIYFLLAILILLKQYKNASGLEKTQIRFVLLGTSISIFFGTLFNLIFPTLNIFSWQWLGQVCTLFMLVFISYAIIKYRLFGIRFLTNKIFIWIGMFVTVCLLYYLASILYFKLFGGLFNKSAYIANILAVAVFVNIIYQPLMRFWQKISDRIFYDGYNPYTSLSAVISNLKDSQTIEEFNKNLSQELFKAFKIDSIDILIFIDDDGYNIKSLNNKEYLPNAITKLISFFKVYDAMLVKDSLAQTAGGRNRLFQSKQLELFKSIKAHIIIPFYKNKALVGFIFIGRKDNNDGFNKEDINFIDRMMAGVQVLTANLRTRYILDQYEREGVIQVRK